MIYLINIADADGNKIVSAKTSSEESAAAITSAFKDLGVDVYRVGWFVYWLQSKSFYKLAAILAPMSNP